MSPQGDTLRFADYSRLPWDIITDPKLKRLDGYVYCVLSATVWQGNHASVGVRMIADILHTTPRRVKESLQRLLEAGKITQYGRKRGQRASYILTSPVFGKKQRGGAEEIVSSPSGHRRLVSVRKTA